MKDFQWNGAKTQPGETIFALTLPGSPRLPSTDAMERLVGKVPSFNR